MAKIIALALACTAVPAFAQTTTTTTSQSQPQAAPPPPSPSTTTVTTQSQPQPAGPSTQVVVNPSDPNYVPPPPPRGTVSSDEVSGVTAPSGRSAVAIIAQDSLYGGVAGALIGAGVTLIDNGNNWARNLMVGGGIGILAGAAYGVYESATQSPPRRAVADVDHAASDRGFAMSVASGRF